MTSEELRDLGKQIARDVASGLMQATAAGAAEFCREMTEAASAAEADSLMQLADRVEQEKATLRKQIGSASGLKRLALEKRLASVEAAERRMCGEVQEQTTPLLTHTPEPVEPGKVIVTKHVRRKPGILNGHG